MDILLLGSSFLLSLAVKCKYAAIFKNETHSKSIQYMLQNKEKNINDTTDGIIFYIEIKKIII